MCQRAQKSAGLRAEYGKLKFSTSSIPHSRAEPIAIREYAEKSK